MPAGYTRHSSRRRRHRSSQKRRLTRKGATKLASILQQLQPQGGRRKLQGGFLPLLIPLIAAAIGAVPGIASAAIAAKQLQQSQKQ